MPAIAIVLGLALFSLLALLLFYWHLLAAPPRRARTRTIQRGGYVKPPAYRGMSHGTIPPPRVTATTGSFSLRSALGTRPAGAVTLEQRVGQNKPTAHGSSGNATGAGASGALLPFVTSAERDAGVYVDAQGFKRLPGGWKIVEEWSKPA